MRQVVGFVLRISVVLTDGHAHRVARRHIRHLSGCLLTAAHRDLLVGGGQIALGGLRLAHRVGTLGKLKGVGVAVGVGAQHAHGLTGRVVDGEFRTLKGVAVVAVGDAGVGTGLVVVLLLFVCCGSAFYGMQYTLNDFVMDSKTDRTFSMRYPVLEKQIGAREIQDTAEKYKMEVQNYAEADAANLVISYECRDFNEEGTKYLNIYKEDAKASLFLPETAFEQIYQTELDLKEGTYQTVCVKNYNGAFDFVDGLKSVKNPDTGVSRELQFGGRIEYDSLASMSDPFAYILNDSDYQDLSQGLQDQYREHLIFFDVADIESSYEFAKELLGQYMERTTELSNRQLGLWNIWEKKLAEDAEETYGYDQELDMSPENTTVIQDWKYAPMFNIIFEQDRMQMISVYVMLCMYICIIALAAIGVMTYVRSISVATDNKGIFESLTKLGADHAYQRMILKKQLAKIFLYPGIVGCGAGFLFSFMMDYTNDGGITAIEIKALGILLLLIAVFCFVLFSVYRVSLKKAGKIVNLN